MKIIHFYEICNYDIMINNIVCLNQYWPQSKNSYSYMNTPRVSHGFIYVVEGMAVYYGNDGCIVRAAAGDVLYLPKGSYYLMKAEKDPTKTMLINFFLFDNCGNELFLAEKPIRIKCGAGDAVVELFCKLCRAFSSSSNQLAIKADFFELFKLLAAQNVMRENISPVMAALDYINENLNRNIKIQFLAKLCAMSESSFRREFTRLLSMSPKKYITEQKINKAKQMLMSDELPIKEIWIKLGFCDFAHFCKIFKEAVGVTPMQYKTNMPSAQKQNIASP